MHSSINSLRQQSTPLSIQEANSSSYEDRQKKATPTVSVTTPTTSSASRLPIKKIITVSSFVLVAAGAGVVGALARVPDGQIAPGVHVMNLDLGGKTFAEAKTALPQTM